MPRSLLWSVLVLVLPLSGCKSWRVETGVSPAEFVARDHPERIQVRKTDKTTLELFNPSVVGDSLKGLPTELAIRPITIPVSDVSAVATRHFSLGKSALLVLAVVGGAFVYDWLMSLNEGF
jgi:hypothetical protein